MRIQGMRVHVVHTDVDKSSDTADREVLVQAEEVANALAELGGKPLVTDYKYAMKKLSAHRDRPDLVFNLVESVNGTDRDMYRAAMFFQNSYYPYTGSSYKSLRDMSDKIVMKRMMAEQDILTPVWHRYGEPEKTFHKGDYIIKPLYEHGSKNISDNCIVSLKDADDADEKIAKLFPEKPENYFAERYIDGREFNVSVIEVNGEPEVLPLAEIIFEGFGDKPKIVCEKAKWDENSDAYRGTVRTFGTVEQMSRLEEKIRTVAVKCWKIFKLSGYARVDMRVDKLGEPYVLEVNGNPSLASDAGFYAASAKGGYGGRIMTELIVKAAMRAK